MKEKIITKARDLFLKVGFKTVTMDDIAKEMGISKKTIYRFFENKEVLIESCTQVSRNEVYEAIDYILSKKFNAIKESFQIKNTVTELFNSSGDSPAYQLKKHYPEIYNQILLKDSKLCDSYLKQNIEKGIAEGLYREKVNTDSCTKFYTMLLFNIKGLTQSEAESQLLELEALEYHIRALATPKGIEELEKQLANFNR
ncbi:MAG: TetR/AcrR family transcriptional regulator [Flavobacterium sp.]